MTAPFRTNKELIEEDSILKQRIQELEPSELDRKREEALEASLSLLSASLESTADGILIVDRKGKITRWNQKFTDMWKIPEEVISSRHDEKTINYILTQLADPEQFVAKVRKMYEQPEESSFDQIEFLDGRVFERYSQPQRIKDNIVGRVWSFRDITERKRMEEESDRRSRQMAALHEMGIELASELNLEALLQSIAQHALNLIGGKSCNFYIHKPNLDLVERVALAGEELVLGGKTRRRGEGAVGQVWATGTPLLINDYRVWPGRKKEYDHFPSRALVSVPIRWGEEFLGVLNILAYTPHRYTQTDMDMLGLFASQAAIAIRNARLHEQMKTELAERMRIDDALRKSENEAKLLAKENAIMAEIGQIISSSLNIDEVYERFTKEVAKLISFDRIVINSINIEKRTTAVAYTAGIDVSARQAGFIIPLAGTLTEECLRTRSSMLIQPENIYEWIGRFPGLLPTFQAGLRSIIAVPLISNDQFIGVLTLRSLKPKAYSDEDVTLIEKVANQIAGAIANAQLFTERKRAEEVLREKERLLSETQQISHIGSWTVTMDSMKSQWSDESYRIFGVTPERFVLTPESFLGLIYSDDRPTMEKWIQDCMTGQHSPELEFRVVRPDGTIRHVSGRGYLNYAPDSTPLRLVGSVQDITDRKRAEEENQFLQERLHDAEKLEMMGKLAGRVAHDLNNVLGVLSGYSELLTEMIPAGNPLREYATNIFKSSGRAAAIIDDLLTLTRRGVRVMEVAKFNKIIADLLATPEFGKLVAYHPNVIIKTDLATDLLNMSGSPVHIEKTVMNLVSNAVEAIVSGGEVIIRTENRYLDKAIEGYQTVMEGEYVVLMVSDTGKGIAASELKNIFEPFYTKKSMGRSGTGLGLAIVRETVQDHHGYMDVQSIEEKGTTFTLYFPATREQAEEETQKTPIEQYMGHGESVMVVDDVKEQRQVATTLLTQLGYKVHAVSGGEDAVEYIKSNEVDILVLDMIMEPGIDGLETYKRVLEINPRQKAIIVSGFSETDRTKDAQRLGAGAYVRKPYIKEKLGLTVRKELDRK